MHAPLALMPSRVAATAIFVRCPASRAIALILTSPCWISGTSRSKRHSTRPGWVRDRVTRGPRSVRSTPTTKARMRSPWRYASPGTFSESGRTASKSSLIWIRVRWPSLLCWTVPVMIWPSRPAKSPKTRWSSASRSLAMMTERAVAWAMRPKFFGVSSNSPMGLPSSSSSTAMTVTRPVFLSISMRASLIAPGMLW